MFLSTNRAIQTQTTTRQTRSKTGRMHRPSAMTSWNQLVRHKCVRHLATNYSRLRFKMFGICCDCELLIKNWGLKSIVPFRLKNWSKKPCVRCSFADVRNSVHWFVPTPCLLNSWHFPCKCFGNVSALCSTIRLDQHSAYLISNCINRWFIPQMDSPSSQANGIVWTFVDPISNEFITSEPVCSAHRSVLVHDVRQLVPGIERNRTKIIGWRVFVWKWNTISDFSFTTRMLTATIEK